jgi:hypothetical protein
MTRSSRQRKVRHVIATSVILLLANAHAAEAHPGAGIVVDAHGQVFFVDTGQGVWKLDTQGAVTLSHPRAYHWMALDEKGQFANSQALGDFDRGSFERITPAGSVPALIISSDYPISVGQDGALYYVPYNRDGPRQLVRRTADGRRSVFAELPTETGPQAARWVNGIATGFDGSFYVADDDAIWKIDRTGVVTAFREAIEGPDCSDALPDTPKLPFLRGLAVHPDGTIYAAASGCRTVIQVPARGKIRTVLRAEAPWSPTAVALSGTDIYVLEYLHTPGDDREEWLPRVKKIGADGQVTTLTTVKR